MYRISNTHCDCDPKSKWKCAERCALFVRTNMQMIGADLV